MILSSLFAIALFTLAIVHFDSRMHHLNLEKTDNLYFTQNNAINIGNINQFDFDGFKLTMMLAIIMAISLGILWISIVHIFPSYAPYIAYVLLAVVLIFFGIFLLGTKNTYHLYQIDSLISMEPYESYWQLLHFLLL